MSNSELRRFGDVIREARLRITPPLSLRKFAEKLDLAAAYVSKIESNQDRPPAADKVEKMADLLGLEKYGLLHLANRLPTMMEEAFRRDTRAVEYMRVAMKSGFSPEELEQMIIEYHTREASHK